MIRVKFDIPERIMLADIVSIKQQGNRIEMSLVYSLLKELDFSPAEVEDNGITTEGALFKYKSNQQKDFELSDQQIDIIYECISIIDNRNEVTSQMIPFLDKLDTLKQK
jgi:hypothetical protein